MAKSIRVVMSNRGAVILLKAAGVQADLRARAQRIADAAGAGHVVYTKVGKTRIRATVVTDTYAARKREARDRNLTRAIDAARG